MIIQSKPELYRNFIDHMVDVCKNGQGQISAGRFMSGVWNENATSEFLPDQHQINMLLKRLTKAERKIISQLLCSSVETGVFETLKAMEDFGISPFESGYTRAVLIATLLVDLMIGIGLNSDSMIGIFNLCGILCVQRRICNRAAEGIK